MYVRRYTEIYEYNKLFLWLYLKVKGKVSSGGFIQMWVIALYVSLAMLGVVRTIDLYFYNSLKDLTKLDLGN